MNVVMEKIPSNLRTPLFFIEFDGSQTGLRAEIAPSLLIGQKLAAGSAAADVPVQVSGTEQAKALFGAGSMLARMVETYRRGDSFSELWCLPVADDGAGVAAEGTLTFTGPATRAGTLSIYIAGQRVRVGVGEGDTANDIATAVAAAVTAASDLPVTAAAELAVVTLTAKHKGALGNDIDLRMNYLGARGGEALPAGVTVAIVAMADGATDPDIADGVAALGDELFDHVGCPYTDTANLDVIEEAWGDGTGRWAWDRQIYGHVYSGKAGTVSGLGTAGNARNDPHATIMGYKGSPTPPWEWAASLTASSARAINIDPARPLQTLPLTGVMPPVPEDRFTQSERNILLYDGISTFTVADDGTVSIERLITTYQKNAFGDPHDAWLDVNTPATLTRFARRMRSMITTKYPRHKLADDGDFGRGSNVVTPSIIRAEIEAEYRLMVREGLVENVEAFMEALIVERDANDPNRINVLMRPDLVNQLRIFAVRNQFLLQSPQAQAA